MAPDDYAKVQYSTDWYYCNFPPQPEGYSRAIDVPIHHYVIAAMNGVPHPSAEADYQLGRWVFKRLTDRCVLAWRVYGTKIAHPLFDYPIEENTP